MTTQRDRALQLLRQHPAGICIHDVAAVYPFDVLTFRNRISELNRNGTPIHSERCTVHRHKSSVARYRLLPISEQVRMALDA